MKKDSNIISAYRRRDVRIFFHWFAGKRARLLPAGINGPEA